MVNWHKLRKRVHALCFLIFLALPFLNVIRFDIPRQRFYFFGSELWINEFAIIFFSLMFLMFVVVAISIFYGRVFCGYLCPQMIFSEASCSLENWLRSRVTKNRAAFFALTALASVGLAFVFISYFVEPRDLFHRLATLDLHTAAGISGATVTLLTFLDFSLVRQKFCTTVCPYGYLQGMFGDDRTLLVLYRDEQHRCIECKKCVRVCPMEIDIRKSPYQIECIHCGECIDACNEVLGRLKTPQPGLIDYSWGEKPGTAKWSTKRTVLALVLAFYACGICVALSLRHEVLVRVAPVRAELYRVDAAAGRVYNKFRYSIANRGHKPSSVVFSVRQLPDATLSIAPNPVPVPPGTAIQGEFEISAPIASRPDLVTHFTIETNTDSFPMTFLAPGKK
jgi:cytochrome c oxidase accessory protein FixG